MSLVGDRAEGYGDVVGYDDFRLTSGHNRLSRERRRVDELRAVLEAVNSSVAVPQTGADPGRRGRRMRQASLNLGNATRWLLGAAIGIILAVLCGLGTELVIFLVQAR